MSNRQKQIQAFRDEINQLIGRIESQEGAGIDEQIAQKQRELERERNEHDKIENEVEVLKLLRDTLSNAQQEATERYLLPVKSQIQPYLNVLFPNAKIEFVVDGWPNSDPVSVRESAGSAPALEKRAYEASGDRTCAWTHWIPGRRRTVPRY